MVCFVQAPKSKKPSDPCAEEGCNKRPQYNYPGVSHKFLKALEPCSDDMHSMDMSLHALVGICSQGILPWASIFSI